MTNPKLARIELGLNQSQMARAMGVHRQTWVKWERGEQAITACPSLKIDDLLWLQSIGILDKYLVRRGIKKPGKTIVIKPPTIETQEF